MLVAELLAFALVLFASELPDFDWSTLSLTSFMVQWVVLLSAAILCRLRPIFARLPLRTGAALSYALILFISALVTLATQWAYYGGMERIVFDGWQLLENLFITAICGGITLRYFYIQQRLRAQQQAELRARIQALQSRIRPHFLFNSMNIIASLIATDPETAEVVVEDLSELFRASLGEVAAEVSLERELSVCRRYIHIEQLRLGNRLHIAWDIEENLEEVDIPLLTIQPLLENAIYHGIQPLPEGGEIAVKIFSRQDVLYVEVRNPVAAHEVAKGKLTHQGNQLALENIRNRLEALYGESATLKTAVEGSTYVTYLHYAI